MIRFLVIEIQRGTGKRMVMDIVEPLPHTAAYWCRRLRGVARRYMKETGHFYEVWCEDGDRKCIMDGYGVYA